MLDTFEVDHWLVMKGKLFERKMPEKLMSPRTSIADLGATTPTPIFEAYILEVPIERIRAFEDTLIVFVLIFEPTTFDIDSVGVTMLPDAVRRPTTLRVFDAVIAPSAIVVFEAVMGPFTITLL